MQNVASKISASIIYAHLSGQTIDTTNIAKSIEYDYGLYDINHIKIAGNINHSFTLSQRVQKVGDNYILVDSSPRGNLGVYYIAIKENILNDKINTLIENLIFYFIIIFSVITMVGYYLANLFIAPIINERKKLNNFIKDTTHELNTPISAILMSTGKNAPLTEKNMQRINLSAKRVSEIYKDLVYIFLQENAKKRVVTNISLDEVIKEQLEYFEAFASKKKLTIDSNIEATSFPIEKENFIRLFNNLLSNAIKYNVIEGKIDIKLQNSVLTIKDTGIGIKKEYLNDIFNRYFRATKEQGGFGLGLNIVYHICKNYDIKIEVSSQENQGTTFILDFRR
jgi:two-component system OmpR family sensor kinase